eukprot:31122-Pelagococcus_subviridis.AAC.3
MGGEKRTPGEKVLKKQRSPRERGRMGTRAPDGRAKARHVVHVHARAGAVARAREQVGSAAAGARAGASEGEELRVRLRRLRRREELRGDAPRVDDDARGLRGGGAVVVARVVALVARPLPRVEPHGGDVPQFDLPGRGAAHESVGDVVPAETKAEIVPVPVPVPVPETQQRAARHRGLVPDASTQHALPAPRSSRDRPAPRPRRQPDEFHLVIRRAGARDVAAHVHALRVLAVRAVLNLPEPPAAPLRVDVGPRAERRAPRRRRTAAAQTAAVVVGRDFPRRVPPRATL